MSTTTVCHVKYATNDWLSPMAMVRQYTTYAYDRTHHNKAIIRHTTPSFQLSGIITKIASIALLLFAEFSVLNPIGFIGLSLSILSIVSDIREFTSKAPDVSEELARLAQ